ncbi:MAG TPA: DUF4112 domain-containing protein [Vicinamibacterales bacterium]|nr:DUF4112 domain-containing protein [Vicinamibacterales bacterium]
MHESRARTLAALRKWSVLLDSAFRVPGTNLSFGLDPILGLIPGFGDLTTPLFAALLLLHGVRMRIPRVIQLRMLINAVIDLLIGFVPVVGDFFDFGWKANVRNLALLERYAHPDSKPSRGDWIFVLSIVGVLIAVTVIPVMLAVWLLSQFRLF